MLISLWLKKKTLSASKQCSNKFLFDSWQWTWCYMTNVQKKILSLQILHHRCHLTKWIRIYWSYLNQFIWNSITNKQITLFWKIFIPIWEINVKIHAHEFILTVCSHTQQNNDIVSIISIYTSYRITFRLNALQCNQFQELKTKEKNTCKFI